VNETGWKLRLFASADLVGSTAYKANEAAKGSFQWASTFAEFFRSFPDYVKGWYGHEEMPPYRDSKHCSLPKQRLSPWKFLGDEILFEVEVSRYEDVACHIWAFQRALAEYPKMQWVGKAATRNLRLKGTAWLAGFPVTNRKLLIKRTGETPIHDYLGPSMDVGFRIAKFSEQGRLVLSVDLALMLLEAADGIAWESHFYPVLHGKEVLKGVIGNEGYPIVFLHATQGLRTAEEELLRREFHCDRTQLKSYLRDFISQQGSKLFRPFIDNGDGRVDMYSTKPSDIERQREEMIAAEKLVKDYADQSSKEPPAAKGRVKKVEPPQTTVK
jgi:hypothetical protein